MKLKPLPEGYEADSHGCMHFLYKGSQVIAHINDYIPPKFSKESFIMSIYESDDWQALEVFYGNYLREQRTRRQGGKGI